MPMRTSASPYQYFADHLAAYAASIAGAAGAALFGARRARAVPTRTRRRLFYLLAASCAIECAFIIVGTERYRRRAGEDAEPASSPAA